MYSQAAYIWREGGSGREGGGEGGREGWEGGRERREGKEERGGRLGS